jgi:hypothetical protein
MLWTAAEEVERVAGSGATHSVLNLSSGTCKAQVCKMLYDLAAPAWNGRSPEAQQNGLAVVENLARFFPLDLQQLLDPNPTVSGPERRALQNGLIAVVEQAWNSEPRIEQARQRFSEAVTALESGRNSVVVAAGNEGLIKPLMELDGLGPLQVPADFERNVLDIEAVTMVGATVILDGIEGPARYTSGDQEIDIYVSGDKTLGQEFDDRTGLRNAGTSMAAPRIGAVMATLHGQHPGLDSHGVESLLEQRFSRDPLRILDYGAASELLRSQSARG